MIGKADQETLQAMVALSGNHNWIQVRKWIEAEMARIRLNIDSEHGDVVLRWNQGALQALRGMLEKFDKARNALDKGQRE